MFSDKKAKVPDMPSRFDKMVGNLKKIQKRFKITEQSMEEKFTVSGSQKKGWVRTTELWSFFVLCAIFIYFLGTAINYVKKYDNDLDFDNFYCGTHIELIDEFRKKKYLPTILPLSKLEKKVYYTNVRSGSKGTDSSL